jgi:phage I-like protein
VFDFVVGPDGKRVAPTEFRVFPAGEFSTVKGEWFFTPRSAEMTMALYRARGNPLMGDYEHQTDTVAMYGMPPIEAPASITSMVPEVRLDSSGAPELWVTDVVWTARARAMLEAGEYRMYSPVFPYDKETREVLGLLRIALTNDPAMDFLVPLVAASTGAIEQENTMPDTTTCAKCSATDAHLETIKTAHAKLLTDHEKLLTDHAQLVAGHQALTAQMKSFDDWAAEESAEHEEGDGTLTAALTASHGGKMPETRVVLAALSAKSKEARAFRAEVVALSGGKDKAAALGALTAWKTQSTELATLKASLDTEKTARLTAEYKTKADAAVKGGKLPPALRKKLDEKPVEEALSFLTAFDGETAPIVRTDETTQPGDKDALTPDEVAFCKCSNIDPKVYIKGRRPAGA